MQGGSISISDRVDGMPGARFYFTIRTGELQPLLSSGVSTLLAVTVSVGVAVGCRSRWQKHLNNYHVWVQR
jgi:hypothetical protein